MEVGAISGRRGALDVCATSRLEAMAARCCASRTTAPPPAAMYVNGNKKAPACARGRGRLHVGALAGFLPPGAPTVVNPVGFLRRERLRPLPALAAEGAAEGRAAVDAKVLARRRRLALSDVARGRRLFDGCHLDVRDQGRVPPLELLNL